VSEPLPPRTRRPWRGVGLLVLVVAGLAVIGEAAYLIGRQVWADHHFRAAEDASRHRDFDAARVHLALCLEIRPDDAEAHFEAARAARRAGRFNEAADHLNRSKELGWVENAVDAESFMLLAQQGDLAKVQATLHAWVKQGHPDSALILEALVQGYLKAYYLPAAMDCLQEWLKREPDDTQALFWRGETWERLHRYDEALADFQHAIEVDPSRDDVRLRLATGLIHGHRPDEAVSHFEALYERQPGNPEVLLGLARCRLEQARFDDARRLLDALLATQPTNGLALGERGRLELAMGKSDEAERWLRRAVAVVPFEREIVYSFMRVIQRDEAKKAEAATWVARLAQIDADLTRMAEVMRLINASPSDPAPRHEAGMLLLRNGQEQEGLRWLDNALRQDPNYTPTHQFLAEYYAKQGNAELSAYHRQLSGANGR
jgi:tetratricopeptide (TPR) repeat protein